MPRTFAGNLLLALSLWAIACVSACSSGHSGSPSAVSAPSGGGKVEEFRLGTGDKIRVGVFGVERMGGDFTIDPDGSIYMPLVGAIGASGSTLSQLAAKISGRLREEKMVDKPQVSVVLVEARPYFIYGEVTKSGSYPYLPGLNVLSAIATAGGFTYRATEGHVYVRRGGAGSEVYVDLSDSAAAPMAIHPGDIIRVPGRFF